MQFSGFQGRALEQVGGDRREVSNFDVKITAVRRVNCSFTVGEMTIQAR